jgi:hypothetical protein
MLPKYRGVAVAGGVILQLGSHWHPFPANVPETSASATGENLSCSMALNQRYWYETIAGLEAEEALVGLRNP